MTPSNPPPPPSRRALLIGGAGLGAIALGGCSPLSLLNVVSPADPGGRVAERDIAYGEHPRQKLDIYVPENAPAKAPVMVFIYGGSWNAGAKNDFAFVGRAFAARGFVTVIPDYRLVPEIRFPEFVHDNAEAMRWVQDNIGRHGGDLNAVHLAGHSAGAYNAIMLGLDRRFLARAGVRPGLVKSVSGLAGPYDFLPLDVSATKEAFGQYPNLAETQPINFTKGRLPRIFIATGDQDETVFPRNTYALGQRLRQAGARVEVKTYPGVGHPGILLALGTSFRGNAPALADIIRFARG